MLIESENLTPNPWSLKLKDKKALYSTISNVRQNFHIYWEVCRLLESVLSFIIAANIRVSSFEEFSMASLMKENENTLISLINFIYQESNMAEHKLYNLCPRLLVISSRNLIVVINHVRICKQQHGSPEFCLCKILITQLYTTPPRRCFYLFHLHDRKHELSNRKCPSYRNIIACWWNRGRKSLVFHYPEPGDPTISKTKSCD